MISPISIANDGYFPFSVISAATNGYTGIVSAPVSSQGGGYSEDYRKHIERLERITRTKEITPAIIAAAQSVDVLPVDAPEIAKIASDNIQAIDYTALSAELSAIQSYLDGLAVYGGMINNYMQEQEDEFLILMMVN